MANVSFNLNGGRCEIDSEPSTPLLYVLRDELNLNGARFGCGSEQCGACRVLVDGEPVFSCTFALADVDGKSVITIEGIGTHDALHPLQQAFLDTNAAQCGFCSSGILVSAWYLLQHNPDPTRADIVSALDEHLCRCGSHNRVVRAVQLAAIRMRS